MVFPATPAVVVLRAAFGADVRADPSTWTWTDITQYWETSEPVTVTDGRSEGATQAEASEATLTLDATDGAMMPEDPRSPYWPHLDVGCPVWMTIDASTGAYDLVQGFISALAPVWPGRSGALCWVRVTVRGVLDRLGRGQSPLKAPLERAIEGDRPVAHWPLSDGQDSTQAASAVSGIPPLHVVAGAPAFAAVDGPAGSPARCVQIRRDSTRLGDLETALTIGSDGWSLDVCILADGFSGGLAVLLNWTTTGTHRWLMTVDSYGGPNVTVWYQDAAGVYASSGRTLDITPGRWAHVAVVAQQSGSDIRWEMGVDGVWLGVETIPAAQVGHVTMITTRNTAGHTESGVDSVALSSLAVYPSGTYPRHHDAAGGFIGETASARITRLCAEERVRVVVAAGSSEPMGPQPAGQFLDLLHECETADVGRLGEAAFGLSYRPRSSLYNQHVTLALDGSRGELADPFTPRLDLQRRRNEWAIFRPRGSSAVYADAADQRRRGRLDDSTTINVATDDVLIHHAAWRVGLGTVGGYRYPGLSVDLGRHPALIAAWQALTLGDRVQATHLPAQHPPGVVDQLVEGRSQTLTGRTGWRVTLVTSPARPYDVGTLDTSGYLDCGACTTAEHVGATDTSVDVIIADTCVWTHVDGDYLVTIGGEDMRVTTVSAVGGTAGAYTQTLTVVRGVNGVTTAHGPDAPVHVAASNAFVLAL